MSKLDEIKEKFVECCGSLSYYNAAEGGSWSNERSGREKCREELRELAQKLLKHDVTKEEIKELTKNQLLSESDYFPYKGA